MGVRSVASDTLTLDIRDAATSVASATAGGPWQLLGQLLRRIRDHQKNRVIGHAVAAAPTSASTQATGATGATVARCNLSAFSVVVNGTVKEFAAEADRVLHDTTVYTSGATTLTDGKSAIVTIVAENAAGTVTLKNIKGLTATTGSQVEPTDALIAAGCTSGASWIKLFRVTFNRTGDTSITQSQVSVACQPILGITQDEDFFQGFTD